MKNVGRPKCFGCRYRAVDSPRNNTARILVQKIQFSASKCCNDQSYLHWHLFPHSWQCTPTTTRMCCAECCESSCLYVLPPVAHSKRRECSRHLTFHSKGDKQGPITHGVNLYTTMFQCTYSMWRPLVVSATFGACWETQKVVWRVHRCSLFRSCKRVPWHLASCTSNKS